MGKKAREYKSGDFIFAKVKGYPAWPARVQRLNGKKYFVYFYGTGETANLPSNMIFDYAENKDKFLTKTQKRRDFNEGVRQIDHDFTNNVPLEEVVGVPVEAGADVPADETANDSAINDMDETVDTTANDIADDETLNSTVADGAVEDSDENGALVIDEGKAAKKKAPKTPATPKAKEAKTPRGKAKKDAEDEEEKKEEEVVSRSGRKIRPKRFVDEQPEDAALSSPAPKKSRRGVSPAVVENEKEIPEPKDKNIASYNAVTQSELEELKQPFRPADPEKENILIAYLPSGKYVGIKLFQSRPVSFKNEASRLQWDKQAASNAITLRMQLERGQIVANSIQGQLVMDLNLNAEERETLDKERETEEKKCRVEFLKTEMKLIEIDAQIKTCLSLEKADTDQCLKLMEVLLELEMKPLMLLKHPSCLETVKRLRNYVGNTPSWDLSEEAALTFNKQAHRIRKLADQAYKHLKDLFVTPDGLSFYEYFQERVQTFETLCAALDATELLELVHEPLGLTQPSPSTMLAAIDAANKENVETPKKRAKPTPKKAATPATGKRQSSRKPAEQEKADDSTVAETDAVDNSKEPEPAPETAETAADDVPKENEENAPAAETSEAQGKTEKPAKKGKNVKEGKRSQRNAEKNAKVDKEAEKVEKAAEKADKDKEKADKDKEKADKDKVKADKEAEKVDKEAEKVDKEAEKEDTVAEDEDKPAETTNETTNQADDTEKVADSSEVVENSTVDTIAEENANDAAEDVNNIERGIIDMADIINITVKKNIKKTPKDGAKSPKGDRNAKEAMLNNEETADNEKPAETTPDTAENKVGTKSPKKSAKDDKIAKDSAQNESEKSGKDAQKNGKDTTTTEKRKIEEDKAEEKKEETAEPRAKRSRETRENKKTEAPPPRSPAKRKAKN